MTRHDIRPSASAPVGRAPRHDGGLALLGGDVRDLLRRHALATGAAGALAAVNLARWAAALVRPSLAHGDLHVSIAQLLAHPAGTYVGHDGAAVRLLASMVFVAHPMALAGAVLATFVSLAVSERRLGRLRTVVAAVVCAAVGVAVGLAACRGVGLSADDWQWIRRIHFSLSPATLAVGPLMAACPGMSPLWRRRIPLVVYTAAGALLLFGGNPGAYCTLAAAAAGHAAGFAARGRGGRRPRRWRSGETETRRLLAAAQLVLALGPVLALASNAQAGPLIDLGLLTASADNGLPVVVRCLAADRAIGCLAAVTGPLRLAEAGLWTRTLLMSGAAAAVAWGLYRGRRTAAWVAVASNLTIAACVLRIALPGDVAPPLTALTALPPILLAFAVLVRIGRFPVRTETARLVAGTAAVLAATAAVCAGYLAYGLADAGAFRPTATPPALLHDLPRLFLPEAFVVGDAAALTPNTTAGILVTEFAGALVWAVALAVALRWFRTDAPGGRDGMIRANRMIARGCGSMGFMATWIGNSYWFAPSGRAGVAYRTLHGVALTTAGPFGDPEAYEEALEGFVRFCERRSWTPVFYAVHESERAVLARMGFDSARIGVEMTVDPSRWRTRGRKWQDVRTAINKARRDGITDVLATYAGAGPQVRRQIEEISEQWTRIKALPEMGFTLGGLDQLRDTRVALLFAVDAEGTVLGVTSWLPSYREGRVVGWTLDFMRHRTDSPNGVMEFLIARMAERLRAQGEDDPAHAVEFMSLSAAPLAGLDDEAADGGPRALRHVLRLVSELMEPVYGFRSLFLFKRKFQPAEDPVHICYPDAARLPQIALAISKAYMPDMTPARLAAVAGALAGQHGR